MAEIEEARQQSPRSSNHAHSNMNIEIEKIERDVVMKDFLEERRQNQVTEFCLFSRKKFNENASDEELMEEIKKKFALFVPLNHIDVILVQSQVERVQEEQEQPEEEEQDQENEQEVDAAKK